MSSSALKVIAVVAVLLAVILAVVGYNYSRSFAEKAQQAEQAVQARQREQQSLAVVALKPLPAYRPIARENVALVPVSVLPAQHFTQLEQVVDKVPLVDIDAGAPVTSRYFAESNALARAIPDGFQAVSVEVDDVVAVGGFLRPGDVVDVLLFLRETGDTVPQSQARVLLEKVRVLAYQERIIDRPEGIEEAPEERRRNSRQRTAVLAVPAADTTRLMLGTSSGDIRLALHGQREAVETVRPETTEGGLPLSASAAAAARKSAEKPVGLAELAGGVSARRSAATGVARSSVAPGRPPAAPRSTVEIVRGTKIETTAP